MRLSLRAVVLALLLAAQGSVFAESARAAASTALAHIERGSIVLGYRSGAAPFSFREHDRVRGYTIELCERAIASIARTRNYAMPKIEWVPLDAGTRIDAVASGRVDAECGTTTITLGRRERVDFTLPIYVDGGSLLVRADGKIARIADLEGKRIAVIGATTTETALKAALDVVHIRITLVHVKDGDEGIAALREGRADGYAGDRVVLTELRQRIDKPAELAFLGQDFSFEPYAIMLRRDDPDFRLALDRALVGIYKSGDIDAIFARWFGELGRPGPLLNAMFYLNMLPE